LGDPYFFQYFDRRLQVTAAVFCQPSYTSRKVRLRDEKGDEMLVPEWDIVVFSKKNLEWSVNRDLENMHPLDERPQVLENWQDDNSA
jgi:hypothetical protein